jgi:hypothetical protein
MTAAYGGAGSKGSAACSRVKLSAGAASDAICLFDKAKRGVFFMSVIFQEHL